MTNALSTGRYGRVNPGTAGTNQTVYWIARK